LSFKALEAHVLISDGHYWPQFKQQHDGIPVSAQRPLVNTSLVSTTAVAAVQRELINIRRVGSVRPRVTNTFFSAAGHNKHHHLRSLANAVGRSLDDALTSLVTKVMSGDVPADIQPFFFSARLAALEKKDLKLRPVAAGETLRRLSGRTLIRQHRHQLAALFKAANQSGSVSRAGVKR
jgi:hypothetical protein